MSGKSRLGALVTLINIAGKEIGLVQMHTQELDIDVLEGGSQTLHSDGAEIFLVGTHRETIHNKCVSIWRNPDIL